MENGWKYFHKGIRIEEVGLEKYRGIFTNLYLYN